MSVPAWWEGHAPIDVGLLVGTGPAERDVHRLRWAEGTMSALEHADLDSELALAALGGGRCLCLDVVSLWRHEEHGLDVLAAARRHPDEHIVVDDYTVREADAALRRWSQHRAAIVDQLRVAGDTAGITRIEAVAAQAETAVRRRLGLVRLLALEPALVDRLQLTALASAEVRWFDEGFRHANEDRLAAALVGRAGPALTAAGLFPQRIELAAPGAEVEVNSDVARFPLSWLTNVWGRGVAVDNGRIVAEVTEVLDDGKVLAVRGVGRQDWRIRRP